VWRVACNIRIYDIPRLSGIIVGDFEKCISAYNKELQVIDINNKKTVFKSKSRNIQEVKILKRKRY